MLTKCPECDLQISDKAITCPHCGYPLTKQSKPTTAKKRRRLPNGFGQISEIKNRNLRNPYRAMLTVGKTETGRPIVKPLRPESYFPTYNEAYAALVEYNRNPYDMSQRVYMEELYAEWFKRYAKTSDPSTMQNHETSWKYCSYVYKLTVQEIRPIHIRECIENGTMINGKNGQKMTPGHKRQLNIKSLFNLLMDYAIECGYIDRNYAREYKLPRSIQKPDVLTKSHIPFTDEEMEILWNNRDELVDTMLIQCYSGWRPNELCELKLSNISPDFEFFNGGSKTNAGRNRPVPIHPKIKEIVKDKFAIAKENGSDYLINYENERGRCVHLRYIKYNRDFIKKILDLGLNRLHRPHDCRKHFVTMAKKYNMDEYAIKYIVGHAITDITEKVYTERDQEWLKSEMKKIK